MKQIVVLVAVLFLTVSCASLQQSFVAEKKKVDVATLNNSSTMAILAVEQAKRGELDGLESYPYSRLPVSDNYIVDKTTTNADFHLSKLVFIEDTLLVGATHILDFYTLSEDSLGRRDLRRNRIIYRSGLPTKEESDAIAASLRSNAANIKRVRSRELRQELGEIVKGYQQENKLDVDGVIGPQTIGSLVDTVEILDIDELSVELAYIDKPLFEAYILKAGNGINDILNQGFESLEKVRKKALSSNEIAAMGDVGDEFLVCIYFFDRIPPESGLKWGISTESGSLSENLSDVYYAVPGAWPMIVGSFTLQGDINASDLAVTVYEDKARFLGLNREMGSFTIR